jgi:nucleoside-diphosphate-sugar epimerase
MSQQVLITGGAGFIGSNLANSLVEENHHVTILDSFEDSYGSNIFNLNQIEERIDIVREDIRDLEKMDVDLVDFDVIFHLAAQLSRTTSLEEPLRDTSINALGTLTLLDQLKELTDPPRFVFTSSQAVYGSPDNLPLTRKSPTKPVDIYGANKQVAERYCEIFSEIHGVPTVSARLTNVYGPRAQLSNPNYGVVNQFIRASLQNETLTVFKPGTMTRDLIHVSDVVSGLRSCASSDKVLGEQVLLSSGNSISVKELANTIVKIAESGNVRLVDWPDDWDSIKIGSLFTSPEESEELLGWRAEVSLKEGLKDTISYYNRNKDKYL